MDSRRFALSLVPGRALRRMALPRDPQARLQLALVLSILVHALAMTVVGVRTPAARMDSAQIPLMVDLVNARTPKPAKAPDILAQANLDGGGNTDADRRAKSPLPVIAHKEPEPSVVPRARRAEPKVEPERPPVLTQKQEKAPEVAIAPPDRAVEPRPETPPLPSATDLLNSSRELVQLEAQVSRSMEAYQKRPRRTFVGARAKEFRFARYIEDWRSKIERIGELNYPAAARGMHGNMLVTVEIRADGVLEKVEINRPSGKKVLDEAAIRIVHLAAPFAPFPPDIAKDTDILSITRTWSFTRSDQFQAE
jgi:protein TonB